MLNCRDVEARLAPFVDGAEPFDAAHAIEAHLRECPPCRARAEEERAGRDLLVACRDELRCQAPEGLRTRCACQSPVASSQSPVTSHQLPAGRWKLGTGGWSSWVPMSVAATVLLAVGAVFVFSLNNPVEALANGLALDHAKCFKVGDSSHAADAGSVEQRWQRERGWALRVARPEPSEQLELVGVRRCLSTNGLAAHIMYRWRGQPLSVYVLPRAGVENRVVNAMGHETAVWSDAGRTYAVMAEGHPADFDHLLAYVKDHTR